MTTPVLVSLAETTGNELLRAGSGIREMAPGPARPDLAARETRG